MSGYGRFACYYDKLQRMSITEKLRHGVMSL
mgnify:CR=1 FL=1